MCVRGFEFELGLRSESLKVAFEAELLARKDEVSAGKTKLEVAYSKTLGKTVEGVSQDVALMEEISQALGMASAAFTSMNGTVKSIKAAIEPCHACVSHTSYAF